MATYNRESKIKAFDETKSGVKGLADAAITEIPQFFHHPPDPIDLLHPTSETPTEIPIIDLGIIDGEKSGRGSAVELVRRAAETLGFFQVLNHGVPQSVLDEMVEGVRRFNEMDLEVKMGYYTRDEGRAVRFNSNFDLYYSPAANWRDTLYCELGPEPAAKLEELPDACRDIIMEYTSHIKRLGHLLFELLSEGLGLDAQYLIDLDCAKGLTHLSHYYPPCPQPELTIGTVKHSDPDFLTVLLQDNIGGLQVLHENQWVDVPSIPGALVINIGDLLQLITNGKYKSVEHRVRASRIGPRVSAACFFYTHTHPCKKRYGPIKKLLSEKNLPKYKDVTVRDYALNYRAKGLDGNSALDNYRL